MPPATRETAAMICVLGMHRSGTSAIAGAIHALGVHLGPESRMMKPREDNPEGFFEHQLLTDLNDEILWTLGGTWHEPPPLPAGWETSPLLDDVRRRAGNLLHEDFGGVPVWGWKDPRTCLTLPFWQPLLPTPHCVLCIRNPIDVARSLQARDGFPVEKGVHLWMQHMTSALRQTSGSPTLLVSYDGFIDHRDAEMARLAAFVGKLDSRISQTSLGAVRVVNERLRHRRTPLSDFLASNDSSYAACAFYVVLTSLVALQRADALRGEELESIRTLFSLRSDRAHDGERAARRPSDEVAELSRSLAARAADVDTLGRELLAMRQSATIEQAGLRRQIDEGQSALAASRAQARDLQGALAASATEHSRLTALMQHLETPLGLLKLGLRACLPRSTHSVLRRWGQRLFPGHFHA